MLELCFHLRYLPLQVVHLCNGWNEGLMSQSGSQWPALGLVVGATDTSALEAVRSISPSVWILCPGVGAQGGEPEVGPASCVEFILIVSSSFLSSSPSCILN